MTLGDFHAGDTALFRELVDEYSPSLLGLALRYVRDEDEAHDIVQDVWLRAFRRRTQLDSVGALRGWLMSICRNACLSEGRRTTVRRAGLHDVPGSAPAGVEAPDRSVQQSELETAVADAIAALPARQRDTVVLRILEGCSTRETAERLGVAEGTVKASLHHALKQLDPLLRSWRDVVMS